MVLRSRPPAPPPNSFHVRHSERGWEVFHEETAKPLSRHTTRTDALVLAITLGRRSGASVFLHDGAAHVRVLAGR
jgi:hypothetical protein